MKAIKDIKIEVDAKSLRDKGFNNFLTRDVWGSRREMGEEVIDKVISKVGADEVAGGTFGGEATINLGGALIKIDGKRGQMLFNDGQTDRILIGFDKAGF